jgi:hypothetical protein
MPFSRLAVNVGKRIETGSVAFLCDVAEYMSHTQLARARLVLVHRDASLFTAGRRHSDNPQVVDGSLGRGR